jgi:atypical dual specificity phosphatase
MANVLRTAAAGIGECCGTADRFTQTGDFGDSITGLLENFRQAHDAMLMGVAGGCAGRELSGPQEAAPRGRAQERAVDWITDKIAIGNIEDAMDISALREAGISGILCLNGFPNRPDQQGVTWVGAPIIDGPGNDLRDIQAAVAHLDRLCHEHRVLVHCAEGLSRSAFIVACYLSAKHNMSLATAISKVEEKRRRACIDKGLLALIERDAWRIDSCTDVRSRGRVQDSGEGAVV